jgi:hypothetical protein
MIVSEVVARAFRWGLFGMIAGPAIIYSMMLGVLYFDERCRTGSMCQLDMGINLTLGVIFGFALFFVVTFIRGVRRRRAGEP